MSAAAARHHFILCEGYDDRAFWKGWLLHLGCSDPTHGGQMPVNDRWGRPVKGGGRYVFHAPESGSEILVLPCGGRDQVIKAVRTTLKDRNHHPDRLIINLDADSEGSEVGHREAIRQELLRWQAQERDDGSFSFDEIRIDAVIWESSAEPQPGVPGKQTLERLVSAALQATWPARGPSVERWLADEPRIDSKIPKNYSLSYLAKWYAEHGANDFFWEIWRDETLVAELRSRLVASGAWQIVSQMAND